MTSLIVMPRSVYEVKSKITDQIRMYLDTGVQRHIGPGDTVIMLGATAARIGLDREMHRDRVVFREFNVVMPESSDPEVAESDLFKRAQQQYEWVMKHLFSGNVLYLTQSGDLVLDKPGTPATVEVVVDDTEKIEKLEKAVAPAPELKIVPNPDEVEDDEPEVVLDDIDVDEVSVEDGGAEEKKSGKKNRKKSKK